jgi:hypothetical protein
MANKYRYPKGHPKAGQFQPAKEGARQFIRENFNEITAGEIPIKKLTAQEKRIYAGLKGNDYGNRFNFGTEKIYDPTGAINTYLKSINVKKQTTDLNTVLPKKAKEVFLDLYNADNQFADDKKRVTWIKGKLDKLKSYKTKSGEMLDVLKLVEKMKQTEWDLIYLGHTARPNISQPSEKGCFKRNTSDSIRYSLGGTGGYMVNPSGAKRLLEFIEKNGMTNAIDTVQQLFADHGNVFYVNPRIVLFDVDEDTDIQKDFDTSLDLDEKSVVIRESEIWEKWGIDPEKILMSPSPLNEDGYHTYQITKNTYVNIPVELITEENKNDIRLTRL